MPSERGFRGGGLETALARLLDPRALRSLFTPLEPARYFSWIAMEPSGLIDAARARVNGRSSSSV